MLDRKTAAPSADASPGPFHLAEVYVDPDRGVVRVAGAEHALQPKVMHVLSVLAQHHGQVVHKEALFDEIWPRGFVVEGVLKRCVFQLRKALGDDAKAPRFIETIPKRGYRLLLAPEPAGQDARPKPAEPGGCPYPGLGRYEFADAAYFAGRAAAVRQALGALDEQLEAGRGFVLLIGPSGSGKSSLARAGLLPALDAQRPGRALGVFQLSEHRGDPFEGVAAALEAAVDEDDRPSLASTLRDEPERFLEPLAQRIDAGRLSGPPVLVVDQCEELLVDTALSDDEREALFATLYALARSGSVVVIATLRSDFYALFARYPLLRQLRSPRGQVDVDFPGPSQITQIVREPARLAGLRFETHADGRTLDEHIIDDAANQPDSLPLLAFLFEELYKHRTDDGLLRFATYEALGGLQGCLTHRAETVYQGLTPAGREALGRVFSHLIRADADNTGRVVATPARAEVIAADADAAAVVEAFVDARLFTSRRVGDGSHAVIKFAHEALFRFWSRARDWVQSNHAELRFRRWLDQLATRWDSESRSGDFLLPIGKPLVEATRLVASGQPLEPTTRAYVEASEARSRRRERLRAMTVAGLAALALVAVLLAAVAGQQARRAQAAQTEAQNAAEVAQQSSDFLVSVFEVADPSGTLETPTARELVETAVRRVDGMDGMAPAVRAQILTAMGKAARGFGGFDIALGSLEGALTAQRAVADGRPADTARVLVLLANLLIERDALEEARARLEEAEGLAVGSGQVEAQWLNEMGRLSYAEGSAAEALVFFSRRLELLRTLPDADPLERASTLNNVAAVHWALGDLDEAAAHFEDAIALRREAAGAVDGELADYLG
ncbi:MAG: winged helix-turn-helix domain-containing protein, partial [Pseudomonadota bacterium]